MNVIETSIADVYLDANYQDIWNAADHRFSRWLAEHLEINGKFPKLEMYRLRLEKAAKEVLDALANDDTIVGDHLDILVFEQSNAYVVDMRALSPVGDAFLLVYRHKDAEIV